MGEDYSLYIARIETGVKPEGHRLHIFTDFVVEAGRDSDEAQTKAKSRLTEIKDKYYRLDSSDWFKEPEVKEITPISLEGYKITVEPLEQKVLTRRPFF